MRREYKSEEEGEETENSMSAETANLNGRVTPKISSKARQAPSSPPQKPWYMHITLDLLLQVLARSVFHPAITLIFYLCLASVHEHKRPLAYYTLYWAAFLAVVEIIIWANRRITNGRSRKVKWEDEVVVITGGGSGLGRVLAQMLMISKGVRVGVLDLKEPDEEAREWIEGRGNLAWQVCDVSDLESVKKAAESIREENNRFGAFCTPTLMLLEQNSGHNAVQPLTFVQLGKPTILINNAAMPVNGLAIIPSGDSSIKTITPAQADLVSSATGGHIVTISSILAHLSPCLLSDYSAGKAALTSLHNTMTHEIANHSSPSVGQNLKTILVEPGMMDTQLFADITSTPWYANFFGPVLDAKDVARAIMNMVERGEGGTLRMPFYACCMPLYGFMPGMFQKAMRWFAAIDKAIIVDKKMQ